MFCFYSLIHLKRCLPFAQYRYDAIYFILLILCSAWGGDTAAYFAGRAFGKHKLAPIVSPHKTVEGAIGGIFGSVLAGVVLIWLAQERPNVGKGRSEIITDFLRAELIHDGETAEQVFTYDKDILTIGL